MTRWTLLALGLILALLATVVGSALYLLRNDRVATFEAFARDHLLQIQDAARILDADFRGIGDDLLFAGELVQASTSTSDRTRELEALLAVEPQYRLIQIFDEQNALVLSVADPRLQLGDQTHGEKQLMRETAQTAALRPEGAITTTAPITVDGRGWFRVFATRLDNPARDGRPLHVHTVAILVDTEPLFSKLRLVTSGQTSALLLLGTHGNPTPITTPALQEATNAFMNGESTGPGFHELMRRMQEAEIGTLEISGEEAAGLQLGDAPLIAAHATISTSEGQHWSIATLSSTERLVAQQRSTMLRLGLACAAISLGLLIIGAFVIRASRQQVAMSERLKNAAQLAHLHEKTEKILDTIPTGVMSLSHDFRITSLNAALRNRLTTTTIGLPLHSAFAEAPPPVGLLLQHLAESALTTGRVQRRLGERLSIFGSEGQYNLHAVPLEPRYPEARILLVVEDLSEVRSLESQLLHAEKLATVGVLAAGIAHEIGTPLGVVRGRAEYLQGKLSENPTATSGLGVIIEQIDRVTRTIRQLLDFSRVRPPTARPVEVATVVRAVVELLRFEGERRHVTLTTEVPEDLPVIAADPDQLQQVLINLVINAYDACGRDGRVEIRAAPAGEGSFGKLRIDVSDNGCGIPEERQAQVFDPFFTTKKRGQGTGLGLTIVAQIVRNHGGEVAIESAEQKGTRVSLLWPVTVSRTEERRDVA